MSKFRAALTIALVLAVAAAAYLFWKPPVPVVAPQDRAPATQADPVAAATAERQDDDTPPAERRDVGTGVPEVPPRSLTGRVLFDVKVPIAGATVLAHRGDPFDSRSSMSNLMSALPQDDDAQQAQRVTFIEPKQPPLATTEVAADGTFELTGLRERHLRLSLRHDLYATAEPTIVHLPRSGTPDPALIRPYLGGCLRVWLSGDEATTAEVKLLPEAGPMAIMSDPGAIFASIAAATREPERIEPAVVLFRAVPAGNELMLFANGKTSSAFAQPAPMSAGERREMALPLSAGAALRARVVDESGAPMAGARVEGNPASARGSGTSRAMSRRRVETGPDGTAELAPLLPGDWVVSASATGLLRDQQTIRVVLGAPVEATFELKRGGTVRGVVLDTREQPIAEAHVAHFPATEIPLFGDVSEQLGSDMIARIAQDSRCRTDAQGRFELTGIADRGTFNVVAAHKGHAAGIAKQVEAGDVDLRIVLPDLCGLRGGAVQAEDGQLLADGLVEVRTTMFLVVQRAVARGTVHAGTFEFAGLPSGSYTLAISADERVTATRSIELVPGQVLDAGILQVTRGVTVRGVVRGADGQPVAQAMVRQRKGGMQDNRMLTAMFGSGEVATTDADGAFALTLVPPGNLQLLATADGRASGRSERLRIEDRDVEGVVIVLGNGGTIGGVLMPPEGDAAQDWLITAKETATGDQAAVTPAPDGRFELRALDPGQYEVSAFNPRIFDDFESADFESGEGVDIKGLMRKLTNNIVTVRCKVQDGEMTEVTLDATDLTHGTELVVDVRLGGRPADGMVELRREDTGRVTMAFLDQGKASVAGLQPGRFTAQVRGGITLTPIGSPHAFEIAAGRDTHREAITLPGARIVGRAEHARTGEPLAGALVQLHRGLPGQDDQHGFALTDRDGRFTFDGLEPGSYSLVSAGGSETGTAEAAASRVDGIRLAAGEERIDVVLRAQPAAGLSITVTDENGRPMPGALLLVVDEDGRPLGAHALGVADHRGRGVLGGLPAGPARVCARAAGFAPAVSELLQLDPRAAQETTVLLPRGASIAVQPTDRHGRPLVGADVQCRLGQGPWIPALLLVEGRRADGTMMLGQLPAGAYQFRVSHAAIGSFVVSREVAGSGQQTLLLTPDR